jgi:hypothetical protein
MRALIPQLPERRSNSTPVNLKMQLSSVNLMPNSLCSECALKFFYWINTQRMSGLVSSNSRRCIKSHWTPGSTQLL